MYIIEFLLSGEVVTISQILITIIVAYIVYIGYSKGRFLSTFAFTSITLEIILVSAFLYFQHSNGHIAEEASEEAHYVAIAIAHGILSLYAIAHAVWAWVAARPAYLEGKNYFREHKVSSVILVLSWVLSLLTGVFL